MKPIIEFKKYSFRYRSQTEPTLRDIDLAIYPGEKILIAGPSGCGKSTLVHCINALIPCSFHGETSGTLTVCGEDPARAGVFGMSRQVGTVLQDTDGQFIGLTVAEDLAFAPENDAVPQAELRRRVAEIADVVSVSKLLSHAPGELSGGQKQRVSLGGVMVDDVRVLLFDEPLANLDPATGKKTIALIDTVMRQRDVTAIIVEHRLEDVLYRDVDRIVVMSEGRIVADMRPDELLCTDILEQQGVREPLYVTAIRYAGGAIVPEDHPAHVETMNLAPYAASVREWFRKAPRRQRKNENPPALEIRHVSFSYPSGEPVLRDVSFVLRKSEMAALVGRNGAGKSTLSSLICGFHAPSEGQILLNGEDIAPLSIKERGERIGLVMQSPNQMISKPMIMEEAGLGLAVRGVPEEEVKRRVLETLRICGLYEMRSWPVSALSFGQKKRVSIAAILVMNPEILILDEPTAGQDYAHYTEIMEFLRRINRELGITILMITHDMHLMLEYTDRAIVISEGRLVTDDTPAHVLTDAAITAQADLKETSLYELALRCGIPEPSEFVERFIAYEREKKG
ncbi:ABC transporter ATP-binding protein [Lachnoclostridium sp. Marseille-P6806]|uniref:ABC transporter ATP-binding protein n=1 Tax=Lachnoclostridium sp. Marseille-P6806 TaxID=2364793 RepID=UPI00102F3BE2|nr:ABC transporter ATP-binding protein [Lachnoclostridium sp. Marseille-P6806]